MISTLTAERSAVVVMAISGNVVIPSKNNSKWGYIRVEQDRIIIDEKGFGRIHRLNALIHGLIKDLKRFNWYEGQELKGTIYFKEQMTPFNPKEPHRDYKVAGKSGIVCCINGSPIYRKTFYSANPDKQDVFILDAQGNPMSHTNGDEIRLAYKQLEEFSLDNSPIDQM